jgi:hypothetical protein
VSCSGGVIDRIIAVVPWATCGADVDEHGRVTDYVQPTVATVFAQIQRAISQSTCFPSSLSARRT